VSRIAVRSGLTATEYLAWERAQQRRHELLEGQVLARPAESPRHYALCVGASIALHSALHGHGCVTFSSDQRIGIGPGTCYVYPDASVVCRRVELQDGTDDVVPNPRVVVEVLSHETEQDDRGRKWLSYQRLPSLADYVLVPQWDVRIEHYRREAGGRWSYRSYWRGERLELAGGAVLGVDEIFAGAFELPGD
jgi:Uma2 family endonuclease